MAKKIPASSRRDFLRRAAALSVGAVVGPYIARDAFAASRDRITIYHSSVADSLHPYKHSSSPIYGQWQHIMEPLVEYDYKRKDYVGILAESWEFQGKRWVMHLKKDIKFHNGAPLTSKDVAFSIDRMRDEKGGSLQASNFKDVTEDAARLAALESGQADLINNIPVHEVARLQRHPRVKIEKIEGLRMFFLAFNVAHKPFDNKLVRQAVNYSVDAPAIIKNIFDGIGYAINGPVGANVLGADPKLKRYPYDPKKAKELLAQAGYPNGCDIQLYYSAGRYPKDTEVCQVVAAQMVKGGFRVELISQEWAMSWETSGVNGGKLPFYYIGRGSLTDADTLYDQYFRTGTTKRSNYSNPELDKLIEEQQKTPDFKKRTAILQQAGKIIMDEAPFVPLYNLADIYGVTKNVSWKVRPDEKVLAWDMKIT